MNKSVTFEKIPAAKPSFSNKDIDDLKQDIEAILTSGRLILGEYTHRFESNFKEFVGCKHAVAVSTCTAALQIALRHANVKGKEVILPTNNFIGVVSAVLEEGGIPVLVDMHPNTFCANTEEIVSKINANTACIIVVDIAGLIYPDIEMLRTICEKEGIRLIEDASHAHGATLNGNQAGNLSEVGCFSFYPTKIMTTCTGGMITTSNADLANYARSVRHHGVGAGLDDVVNIGSDWCLSEIHAAMGLSQLKHLSQSLQHRRTMVTRYKQALSHLPWLSIPEYPENTEHAYYKFPTLLDEDIDTMTFRRTIYEDFNIENGAVYNPPCHLQPALRTKFGYSEGMFPVAESILNRQFCPPIHSTITPQQVDNVIDAIIQTGQKLGLG